MAEKLDIYTFGRQLLETGDLDPVYILLWEAQLEPEVLYRWLLAYWCFYHVGTASCITWHGNRGHGYGWNDDEDYWGAMRVAAGSKDYPRSRERRHFRGENARRSVEYLAGRGIKNLFGPLMGWGSKEAAPTATAVMVYVQEWVGFGPWISFKVADMVERLGMLPVRFDLGTLKVYDSPREGAELLAQVQGVETTRPVDWAVSVIHGVLNGAPAPPRGERPINVQEVETILCKWHGYMGGHYQIGEDIHACRTGLLRFGKCRLAQQLLAAGRGKLW